MFFVKDCLKAAPIITADLALTKALSRGGHRQVGNRQLREIVVKDQRILNYFKKQFGSDLVTRLSKLNNPKGFSWHHSLFKKKRLVLLNNSCHRAYHKLFGKRGGFDKYWRQL